MFNLEVINKDFNIKLTSYEKYSIILGYTGQNKTRLFQFIKNAIDNDMCDSMGIKSSHKIIPISSKNEIKAINNFIEDCPVIFLVDEYLARNLIRVIKNKNAYCIAIIRKVMHDENMSFKCIHEMTKDSNGVTTIKQKYDIDCFDKDIDKIDCILTEDKDSADTIFRHSFNVKIFNAGGKGRIASKLNELSNYNKILLFADEGGLASDIEDILSIITLRNLNVVWCLPVCLEHLLLCSKFFNYSASIYDYYDIRLGSTESYCKHELENISAGTPMEYKHLRDLSECWTKECTTCANKKSCKYFIDDNKESIILSKGPCSYLIHSNPLSDILSYLENSKNKDRS